MFRRLSGAITKDENIKSTVTYPFFKEHGFVDGVYYLTIMKDNVSRYVGFRKLVNYPVFVEVGVSFYECMQGYFIETIVIIWLMVMFTLFIIHFLNKEKKLIDNIEKQNVKLNELNEIAEQTDYLKSRFIGRMSHKLKNPLNIIIGYADLISMNIKDEKQLEQFGYIKQASYSLLDLVTNLLEVSRHDTLVINSEHYYIGETLIEVYDLIDQKIKDKNLKLFVPEDNYVIFADRIRMRQALLNIIENSIQYTNHGGDIIIKIIEESDYITMIIADTGIGMDDVGLAKAVKVFGQGVEIVGGGVGIGLPLTKKIIESMGGIFEISSVLNVGTIVTMKVLKGNFG